MGRIWREDIGVAGMKRRNRHTTAIVDKMLGEDADVREGDGVLLCRLKEPNLQGDFSKCTLHW